MLHCQGEGEEGRKELLAAKQSAFHFNLDSFAIHFFPKVSWISIIYLSSPDHHQKAGGGGACVELFPRLQSGYQRLCRNWELMNCIGFTNGSFFNF